MMGKTENFLSRRRNKDGKVLDLEISIVPVYINSTVVSTQVIYRNLDDIIIKGQNALTFDALANNFLDGIVITNSDRIISYSNKAFNEMSGFTVDEIVGKKPDKIFRSNYHDKFYYENISKAILKKGKWQGELWNKQKDGSIKPYWLQIFSINSEDNITLRYVAIYKDLAGININKKILSMLGKDALTTIPNRTKFIEDVEEAILNFPDDQFHVAFLDINDFKVVNDEYGHSIGDKILIEFSKRLHMVFKDQIIGRYGGDEFVIFIKAPNDFKDVEMMFNKLTNLIKNIEVEGNVFNLTLSIGVATYPFDSRNIDALIDYADKAMYISKRNQLSLYKYK